MSGVSGWWPLMWRMWTAPMGLHRNYTGRLLPVRAVIARSQEWTTGFMTGRPVRAALGNMKTAALTLRLALRNISPFILSSSGNMRPCSVYWIKRTSCPPMPYF